MNPGAPAWWARAITALATARRSAKLDPDSAVSRAFYAAFYAVSAHFAKEGREFSRHSAVEAAVHRDLVHAGLWTPSLGKDYSMLWDLRTRCDYGALARATEREAADAVAAAERILKAVSTLDPESCPPSDLQPEANGQ